MLTKDHPLVHQKYILPTNAVETLLNTVVQWLDLRVCGGLIFGMPRGGKTFAVDFIRGRLNDLLDEPIPILSIEGNDEQTDATPKIFWSSILEDIGSRWADSGTARECRRRVIQTFHAKCIAARSSRLLLFLDDAQWFSLNDYAKLVDLRKQMRRRQIELILISVGQEELSHKPGTLSGISKWPVIGRFMQEQTLYRGANLGTDLARILNAYDEDTEYPDGSGVSYTQAAVPSAWDAGFRILSTHEDLANAITETRLERTGGIDTDEYPMPPLVNSINGLLRELSESDAPDLRPSKGFIKDVVRRRAGALIEAEVE
ncbi:MAG: ATP-binding protein [Pseudomonadota bacterium]